MPFALQNFKICVFFVGFNWTKLSAKTRSEIFALLLLLSILKLPSLVSASEKCAHLSTLLLSTKKIHQKLPEKASLQYQRSNQRNLLQRLD